MHYRNHEHQRLLQRCQIVYWRLRLAIYVKRTSYLNDVEQSLETIALDLEDVNELAFKLKIEGVSAGAVTARLYCESNDGHMHAFPGQFLGEPETVTFRLSKMQNLVSEGVYPGWVEVIIDSKQFVPVKFNLKFKKPVSVQIETVQKREPVKEAPSVSATALTVNKKSSATASSPVQFTRTNLKEWYKGKPQTSLK